jgi:hypothetical protein
MKKIIFSIALIVAIFLFVCHYMLEIVGGGNGNIEKYSFSNISPDSLKIALNRTYAKYPELIKTDTVKYGSNNGDDFFYVLNSNNEKIVFLCNVVIYSPPYDKDIDLSLTTATTWGQTMQLASQMGFFEKRKFRRLFEENILPKIKEQFYAKIKAQ